MTRSQRLREQTISTETHWESQLNDLLTSSSPKSKVALVGVGHPMRGDDYVGSFIAKRIIEATDSSFPDHVFIFDAEDSPESLISTLSKIGVRHVVFIDACEMRKRPGEMALLSVAETSYPFFTTHGIPLKVLAENLLAGCEVWVLSIQPKQSELEEEISPELREAAEHVADFIIASLSEGGDEIA